MKNAENIRRHERTKTDFAAVLSWPDPSGQNRSVDARGLNLSKSGLLVICSEAIAPGTLVYLQGAKYSILGQAYVRRCLPHNSGYALGLEFTGETASTIRVSTAKRLDYYELLQISRNAEQETIHRVFRIMAARFHPDNPETGDHERFVLLKQAFKTLSDPVSRAQYDATYESDETGPNPIFELRDFVDEIPGELNRRLGVLCLLYNRRRQDPDRPGLSLLQLEQLMSFPREYLNFAIWFLKEREFIRMTDNSDYALTANGAEYVESKIPSSRLAVALLCKPAAPGTSDEMPDVPPSHFIERQVTEGGLRN